MGCACVRSRAYAGSVATAVIGFSGIVVGVLLGGGVQLIVSQSDRRAASKRAARLLFGTLALAIDAVALLKLGMFWDEKSAPPLDDWRSHREALAGAMDGPAFHTVDRAFFRVANLDNWIRNYRDEITDIDVDAEEVLQQLRKARA